VEAPVALTSVFLPAMVERGRGAILNVASTAGMQPMPYSAGYSAGKAYALRFSEAIHQEVRKRGVTVTALAPGPVETEFWEGAGWQAGGRSFEQVTKPAMISAEDAARAGVRGLESGERVVLPGLPMRTAMFASRYIPHALKLPALERAMRPRAAGAEFPCGWRPAMTSNAALGEISLNLRTNLEGSRARDPTRARSVAV